ncbi:MAG: nucleotidyltransferase domain-containing protein [Endomicrobia bacterium]|nr:nucleotidyltransferase domain-containing protein [Endomicrobiia bacterium]
MNKKINQMVLELRKALKNSLEDFEGLYLYGSHVKGNAKDDSDVDVVVILDRAGDRNVRGIIWDIVSFLDYKYDLVFDLHPMTREELERNPVFYDEVVNKGIFYDAA